MTIICALKSGDEVWIGSDTRLTDDDRIFPGIKASKWLFDDSRALGFSGSSRARNITLDPDDLSILDMNPLDIADELHKRLKNAGFETRAKDGGMPILGGTWLLAREDGIYEIDSGFGCDKVADGNLWAAGSGANYALGADFIAGKRHLNALFPDSRISWAVEAAMHYDTGCGGEVFVRRLMTP